VRANSSNAGTGFAPTLVNRSPVPSDRQAGMEWIPGGEFSMGANDPPDRDISE
jgi:formylglycine-generating enzyme